MPTFTDSMPGTAAAQGGAQSSTELRLTAPVVFDEPFDYDLVRVAPMSSGGNTVSFNGPNSTGRIGRLEVEHNLGGDAIRFNGFNDSPPGLPHDILIEEGYAVIREPASPDIHVDGVQAIGGNRVTIRNFIWVNSRTTTSPGGGTQGVFINAGGSPNTTQDFVIDGCVIVLDPDDPNVFGFSSSFRVGSGPNGPRTGIRNSWVGYAGNAPGSAGSSNTIVFVNAAAPIVNENNLTKANTAPEMVAAARALRVPWGSAPTYTDSRSGTAVATGARTESMSHDQTVAGTAAATATADESYQVGTLTFTDSMHGTAAAAGTGTDSHQHDGGATGSATATGAAAEQFLGVWYRQWVNGWTRAEVDPGCSASSGIGNKVTASTHQTTGEDRARYLNETPALVPGDSSYIKGQVRFNVTSHTAAVFGAGQMIFALRSATASVFRLVFDATGTSLDVQMARMAGGGNAAIVANVLNGPPVVGQGYLVEYVLERSATGLQHYLIKVDGATRAEDTPPAATLVDPVTFWYAGFTDAANVAGTLIDTTVEVWDVAVANADVELPADPSSTPGVIEGEGDAGGEEQEHQARTTRLVLTGRL